MDLADPRAAEILQKLATAAAALRRCPAHSAGRRGAESLLAQAGALIGVRIGDDPDRGALGNALRLAAQAMQRQLRLAEELERLPIETVRRLWRLPDMPVQMAREIAGALRRTAQDALATLDRNAPLLAATWGQVATGVGGGAVIAIAVVAFFLLKK